MASPTCMIQNCGEIIRPEVNFHQVGAMVETLYGLRAEDIAELNSYEDRNYHLKIKEIVNNKLITELNKHGYTLKVLNSLESQHPKFIDAQNELMTFLHQKGVGCPTVVRTVDNQLWTLQQFPQTSESDDCKHHIVRLLTFVPGTILYDVEYTAELISNCGSYLSELHHTMKKFHHPAFLERNSLWSMSNCQQVLQFLVAVENKEDRKLVEEIISKFQRKVKPLYPQFFKGLIHGDFNEHNILVQRVSSPSGHKPRHVVSGILDFADVQESFYIFDVAIAIMYLMVETRQIDPLAVGGYFLAGYTANRSLSDAEWMSLKICIAARFCVSLVMGLYNYSLYPENEYLLVTQNRGWPLLKKLWAMPTKKIHGLWKTVMTTL